MKQEYNRNLIYRFLYLFIGFYRFVGTAKIESIALKLAREIEVDVIDIMIPSNKFLNGKNINIPRTMIKILILDTHFRCFVVSNEKPEANKTPERDCNFVLDIISKETARERIAVK